MNDLDGLIDQWKNSTLGFLEVERLITLLIVDNKRLTKFEEQAYEAHPNIDRDIELLNT